MLLDAVEFWVEPSSGRSAAFFLAFIFLGGIIILVQLAYRHRVRVRWEGEFVKRLRDTGILGKPEEGVLRDLVERYKISPPGQILSGLALYDEVASQEIHRVETAIMPLADRIDRIEYLYSIRIQAFANDPAVGGADVLLPKESPTGTETPQPMPPTQPVELAGGAGPDLSLLLADLGQSGPSTPSKDAAKKPI